LCSIKCYYYIYHSSRCTTMNRGTNDNTYLIHQCVWRNRSKLYRRRNIWNVVLLSQYILSSGLKMHQIRPRPLPRVYSHRSETFRSTCYKTRRKLCDFLRIWTKFLAYSYYVAGSFKVTLWGLVFTLHTIRINSQKLYILIW